MGDADIGPSGDATQDASARRFNTTAIPIWFLRERLDLAPETPSGLRWRERPREHFPSSRAQNAWNARYAGMVAGSLNSTGYLEIRLTFGGRKRHLLAHRVIYALVKSEWPEDEIDHVRGVEAGNGIANLRLATRGENHQNNKNYRNNSSGFPGVCWHRQRGKWVAQIGINRRRIRLGYFVTPEQAFAAYLDARARLFPFQPVPRDLTPRQAAMAGIWASLRRFARDAR